MELGSIFMNVNLTLEMAICVKHSFLLSYNNAQSLNNLSCQISFPRQILLQNFPRFPALFVSSAEDLSTPPKVK